MAKIPIHKVKRPAQGGRKPGRAFRAIDDVDTERLKLLSAINIEFNSAEDALAWGLGLLIGNIELQEEIVSRINGLEGKVEIAKRACRASLTLSGDAAEAICDVLSNFMVLKSYRDALAHVRLHNEADDIVFTFTRQGRQYEADISLDTLRAVNEHMYHLTYEMSFAYQMMEHNWSEIDLELQGAGADPKIIRREPAFLNAFAQLQNSLNRRKLLLPIPEFPETPQAPPKSEGE